MSSEFFFPGKVFERFYDWFKLSFLKRAEAIEDSVEDIEDGTTDLTAYLKLAGRSGGQVAYGGTGSGDDLTLHSTSHATKGTIFLGTGSGYNQVNNRLGVGTTAPGATLDVRGSAVFNELGGNSDFRVEGDTDTHLLFCDASVDGVGIGTSTPSLGAKLHVAGSSTYNAVNARGAHIAPTINSNSDGIGGVGFQPILKPSAALTSAYGIIGLVQLDKDSGGSSRNVTSLHTNYYRTDTINSYAGTIAEVHNFYIAPGAYAAGTTVTAEYGLRVGTLAKGATKWGVYVDANDVYFGAAVRTPNIHNVSGGTTKANDQICSGTYTPTLTNVANVATHTMYAAQWIRVGRVVTVSGQVDVDPTAAGAVQFVLNTPISSTFTHSTQLAGAGAVSTGVAPYPVGIHGVAGTSNGLFTYNTPDGVNRALLYHYTYQIV